MSVAIIITTIYNPTEAVRKFAKIIDHDLIVVGDNKTPSDWKCDNTTYLRVNDERTNGYRLHDVLPYNHYSRKMLGYIYAIKNGYTSIVDTDDDNIPKPNWKFPDFEGTFQGTDPNEGFINVYRYFTDQQIWPRGLPLRLISDKRLGDLQKAQDIKIGIWQGLADEDPDVDAIYRLTSDQPCYFEEHDPFFLSRNTISPFNTQNTLIRKELFPLLYLPISVTFRFTDILRSLVAQPIMWLGGYHLGFVGATVVQKRNPHNYFDDFLSELPIYEHTENTIRWVNEAISPDETIGNNLYRAYTILCEKGIVSKQELTAVKAWLKDTQ